MMAVASALKHAEANLSAHNANHSLLFSAHTHVGLPDDMPALCLADWDCTHVPKSDYYSCHASCCRYGGQLRGRHASVCIGRPSHLR